MSAKSLSTGGHHLGKFRQQFLMKTPLALTRTANEAPQKQEHNELAQVVPRPTRVGSSPSLLPGTEAESFQQPPGADSDFCCSLPVWKTNTEPCLSSFALLPQCLILQAMCVLWPIKEVHIQYFTVLPHWMKHLHFLPHIFPSSWEQVNDQISETKQYKSRRVAT